MEGEGPRKTSILVKKDGQAEESKIQVGAMLRILETEAKRELRVEKEEVSSYP